MSWVEGLKVAYSIYDDYQKSKVDAERAKAVVSDINNYISDRLNSLRLTELRGKFQGVITSYQLAHSLGIENVKNSLIDLNNFHYEIRQTVMDNLNVNINYAANDLYPIYSMTVGFISVSLSQFKNKFATNLDDWILTYFEQQLETLHHLEQKFSKHLYENDSRYRLTVSNRWRNVVRNSVFQSMKPFAKERDELDQRRKQLLANLNNDFFLDSPEYGGFEFSRCPKFSYLEESRDGFSFLDDRGIKVKRHLAVNNSGSSEDDPSIMKDVQRIEQGSEVTFEVTLKSEREIGREIKVVIWELGDSNTVIADSGKKLLTNEWQTFSAKGEKQHEFSILRFEVYWYDNYESDIIIKNFYIDIHKQKKKEIDPSLYIFHWENRSKNKVVYFNLSGSYISSQFLAANDANGTFGNPSVYQDVWILEKDVEVTFEAHIKSSEDIGRQIELQVWELYIIYGRSEPFNGEIIVDRSNGPVHVIDSSWNKFHVNYRKKDVKSFLRFEIYWHDNKETDILLDNIRVYYT
ncbi:MAG: hypothetical protein U9Q88_00230 [Bacillota bacterium]|nr:hypothetical protein [Bacillota bacterium]